MRKILAYLFPVWLFGYSVYTFSQTDPNLVLSSNPTFWSFQQVMWQLGYHNRLWSTAVFLLLVTLMFASYLAICQSSLTKKQLLILFVTAIVALIPSYPALSHDIFNYIFNAKMVLVYHANPHVLVALNFPKDPWLRFMNNVDTPAPYGYGWTSFSLLPYLVGRGYLQGELLIFRLTMILALVFCLWLIPKIQRVSRSRLALLAFNPLVLIEMVSNIHNDLVMMAACFGGWLLMREGFKKKTWGKVILGIFLFGFSISIKYVTVVLIGSWVLSRIIKRLSLSQWSAVSLWIPLLTNQSQRFLSWYLSWSLLFLPFIRDRRWQAVMIAASFAGLVSYSLFLYQGAYSPTLLMQRSLLLFSVPLITGLVSVRIKR